MESEAASVRESPFSSGQDFFWGLFPDHVQWCVADTADGGSARVEGWFLPYDPRPRDP